MFLVCTEKESAARPPHLCFLRRERAGETMGVSDETKAIAEAKKK